MPSDWRDTGHVFLADGTLDPAPPEVSISGLGALQADGTPGTNASWDTATRTCSSVYCHGGAFIDSAAGVPMPNWDLVGVGQAACGNCHGTPPASHGSDACETCHGGVASAPDTIADAARHINGTIDLGREPNADPTSCIICHGSAMSPAPPTDVYGQTSTSIVSVGAHATHLFGRYGYSSSVTCSSCHIVPSAATDAGHLDSPLPAEVTFGALATTTGATPAWNRADASCADVYCHGGGSRFASDTAPSRNLSPIWTSVGTFQIVCGSCHGVPPQDGFHLPTWKLSDCSTCHSSVDAWGNILFVNGATQHLNGVLDGP